MKKKNIDAYLIQETHLSGDFEKFIIDNYYFIHHGPEAQPTKGAKGGVAIILSPELHSLWQSSGKAKKIIRGGILAGETTRILSVSMKIEVYSESNGEKKKKYHNLCLTTIYFPHSGYKEKEIDSFNNDLSTFLSNILSQKNTTHIIGADTNSSIGTRISTSNLDLSLNDEDDEDPISNLLGPFGNPRKSKSAEAILNHMREFQLRAASSFFDNNNKYNTWIAPPHPITKQRIPYQLDQIFIPKNQLCYTSNVKRKFDGAPSDHAAVMIDFKLISSPILKTKNQEKGKKADPIPKKKIDNNILRNKELPNFKKRVEEFFENLSLQTTMFSTPSELIDEFESHIAEAAFEVAAAETKTRPDWFTEAEQVLIDAIEKRNIAFKNHLKHPSELNKQTLREARHHLLREKRKAKRQWQLAYAARCKKKDFCVHPKEAWQMVFRLMEGFQKHHRVYLPRNFKTKNGVEAKNDQDNATILNQHFHSLFNSNVQVDPPVLNNLPQHPIQHHLGNKPTKQEVKNAISDMSYDKAPGQSGVTTDMIKNLPDEAFEYYVKLIQDFWTNPSTDFSAWHTTLLKVLYKGKGDPQDPNNYRGIALKETSAKVMSIILAKRLLKRFKQINPTSQFGHIGCQEAQHIIKRALLLRRQHGLESFAIFVDLVKAFDTVNHHLLCQILSKYGIPPAAVQIVQKLYRDCSVKIKVGSKFTEVDYTTGVHQGDNMSPVLFLFVIQAFVDTLNLNIQPTQFAYFPENKNGNLATIKGRLLSQDTSAKGTPLPFNTSFYVDDSFFLFSTKQELQQAIETLDKHFARFGLIMHLGSKKQKSKSEAMYFPPSLQQAQHDFENNILPEDIILADGKKVHFVNRFKYLGSIITPLLNEDIEIDTRIKKAKSIMGTAKTFFDNKDVDKRIKCQVYVAGPLNALLWGCESWNLTRRNLDKLASFHHNAIRRILGISWNQVREKHIKNREVRGLLCNIPNVDAYITRRTATYLGKISRSDDINLPKKFLTAWINKKRKNGAPQLTCNNNFASTIQKILPTEMKLSNKQAHLREWYPLAKDQATWSFYIDAYFETCRNIDFEEPNPTDSEQ